MGSEDKQPCYIYSSLFQQMHIFKPQNVIFMLSLDIRITALQDLLCVLNKYDIYRLFSLSTYLLCPELMTLKIALSDGVSVRRFPKKHEIAINCQVCTGALEIKRSATEPLRSMAKRPMGPRSNL